MKFGLLICSLLMCCAGAFADNGQSPLTPPKATFFNNGVPASGYKVCTYAAGTTTPLATYVAFSSGTTNTNPVILDSQGRANIWLGSSGYKIVLMTPGTDNTCSTGTVVTSTDNVGGFCPLQGCTFNGNIHLVGANFLAISSSNATAATIASTATSGGGVNAIASGTGNTIGVLGQVTSTLGIGVLAISGGDIFAGQNAGFSTVFRVANNGEVVTSHGIAINGGTEITGQTGTGGTAVMSVAPAITGNMTYASTTPVANLTGQILAYNISGTQQTSYHAIIGSCVLGTNCAITLTNAAVYTNAGSYFCWTQDVTAAAATKIVYTSGSAFTITGTGTDGITFGCIGN